jgi:cyclic pyranopterin phosphate synthase
MDFSHLDNEGVSRMVDVSGKTKTSRYARATGSVFMSTSTLQAIEKMEISKGNVIEVARIAGFMAAKRTAYLIPMCHQINLEFININIILDKEHGAVQIESIVKLSEKTGAEMEALVAVATSALTIYDMCKSVDKAMIIGDIKLIEKSGGKSGKYIRD